MTEAEIQARSFLLLGREPDVRLFRNTVGFGWQGDVTHRIGGVVYLRNARPVTFGLCPGSPDAVGWRSITVTPDMVGQRVAVFAGLEFKTQRGRSSAEQVNFLDRMTAAGAVGGVARSPEEARCKIFGIYCLYPKR